MREDKALTKQEDSEPVFKGIMYFDKYGNSGVVESKEYTDWKNKHNGQKENGA